MDSRLEVIKQRMIDAGISADEVDNLVKPLASELERRVCGLVWKHEGATTKLVEEMEGKLPVLTPVKDKNIVTDINGINHVLIEGENLLTLMAMQYTHIDENRRGLVDVIYIDPPYNTESTTMTYNDKFEKSEWLSMMSVRLRLAKNLLSDDGVIFLSIDDRYQSYLQILCDEIFGSDMFCGCLPRITKKSGKSTTTLAKNHDYILIYTKKNKNIFNRDIHVDNNFKYKDKYANERGAYKLNQTLDYSSLQYSESMDYKLTIDGVDYYAGGDKAAWQDRHNGNHNAHDWVWRWSPDLVEWGLQNDWLVVSKTGRIYSKTYLNASIERKGKNYSIKYEDRTKPVSSISFTDNIYSNDNAKKNLDNIKIEQEFEYSKPVSLIVRLLKLYYKDDAIVLDFFAGSGTTGQAVLELNAEDNGTRQVILCTNNEVSNNAEKRAKSNGVTSDMPEWEDYGVCHAVTYPRLKTVITGERMDGSKYSDGMAGNNLYYYQVSDSITESPIPKITKDALAKQAVSYIALKENIFNVDEYKDYHILHNVDTEIIVVIDPDRDYRDVQDNIASQAFSKVNRKVYCSLRRRTVVDGIEYIPYPEEVLDVLKSVKKRVRKESK